MMGIKRMFFEPWNGEQFIFRNSISSFIFVQQFFLRRAVWLLVTFLFICCDQVAMLKITCFKWLKIIDFTEISILRLSKLIPFGRNFLPVRQKLNMPIDQVWMIADDIFQYFEVFSPSSLLIKGHSFNTFQSESRLGILYSLASHRPFSFNSSN